MQVSVFPSEAVEDMDRELLKVIIMGGVIFGEVFKVLPLGRVREKRRSGPPLDS